MKYLLSDTVHSLSLVAPLVGAWIEIWWHLVLVCTHSVAPLVGAWIEIPLTGFVNGGLYVAPLVGAWIEISERARLGRM